jgi:hypothetical protein
MSGQIFKPNNSISSPVLTIIFSSSGLTIFTNPSINLAAPIPPAKTK